MILYGYTYDNNHGLRETKLQVEEKPKTYKSDNSFMYRRTINKTEVNIFTKRYSEYYMITFEPSLELFKTNLISVLNENKKRKIIEINDITRQIQLLQR